MTTFEIIIVILLGIVVLPEVLTISLLLLASLLSLVLYPIGWVWEKMDEILNGKSIEEYDELQF